MTDNRFQLAGPDLLGHLLIFPAQELLQTLELGQTKASNEFSILKMGGSHMGNPWDPLCCGDSSEAI